VDSLPSASRQDYRAKGQGGQHSAARKRI